MDVYLQGKQQYETLCVLCHKLEVEGDAHPDPKTMLAPAAFAVAYRYEQMIPDEAERIEAIVEFVKKPTEEAVLMPGAVAQWGLMAPLPLPDEQLQAIATYMVYSEFEKPAWFDAHYGSQHGQGRGRKKQSD